MCSLKKDGEKILFEKKSQQARAAELNYYINDDMFHNQAYTHTRDSGVCHVEKKKIIALAPDVANKVLKHSVVDALNNAVSRCCRKKKKKKEKPRIII